MALNEPMNGRMLSVRGADEHCWQQSRGQNLTGKYRAFISNRFQHLYSIIHRQDRSLPVGNLQVTVDNNSFDMGIVFLGSPSPLSISRNSSFSLPVNIHRGVLRTRGICTTLTEYFKAKVATITVESFRYYLKSYLSLTV